MSPYSSKACCIWFYHLCLFLYTNYHSITKNSRAISCHSLIPAWYCKQTWLLSFVLSIGFTNSHFHAYEKRQFLSLHMCECGKMRIKITPNTDAWKQLLITQYKASKTRFQFQFHFFWLLKRDSYLITCITFGVKTCLCLDPKAATRDIL